MSLRGNLELGEFRTKLAQAFPPQPFYGLVSTHDECDEGIALRRELPGKRWDEVPSAFVDDNSLSLPLLEERALVAFLPAWLVRSIEKFDGDNLVLEFTVYFLCPGSWGEYSNNERLAKLVKPFDATQLSIVGEFLGAILERDDLALYHDDAKFGLTRWRA
jgi:hypothetical protein